MSLEYRVLLCPGEDLDSFGALRNLQVLGKLPGFCIFRFTLCLGAGDLR